MSDIAQKAGVSRSTVSLVLNDKHAAVGIPESTRRRVLVAAKQLGYRPNEIARSMPNCTGTSSNWSGGRGRSKSGISNGAPN